MSFVVTDVEPGLNDDLIFGSGISLGVYSSVDGSRPMSVKTGEDSSAAAELDLSMVDTVDPSICRPC